MNPAPIGVFDSGVGGLSILREIRRQLPEEDALFFADQAHVPFGPRPMDEVRRFSEAITRFLLSHSAKLIVVACNTASAAALHHLRATFPETPFVGMEPAVKPAAQLSNTRTVGVLATPATFQGELFASVVERFAAGVEVIPVVPPDLVTRIEAGDLDGRQTRGILERAITPLLERGVDTLVLACTHYPFIIPLLKEVAGPNVHVIDPSPAIARQTGRLLAAHHLSAQPGRNGEVTFYTSGRPDHFMAMAERLIAEQGLTAGVHWGRAEIKLAETFGGERRPG